MDKGAGETTPEVAWALKFTNSFLRDLKARGMKSIDECLVSNEIVYQEVIKRRRVGITELAEITGISRSKVSRIIHEHLEEGWIAEGSDEDDLRKHPVTYTHQGLSRMAEWASWLAGVARDSAVGGVDGITRRFQNGRR